MSASRKILLILLMMTLAFFNIVIVQASPSSYIWVQSFSPRIVERRFEYIWGGDVYKFTGSDIVLEDTGKILYDEFDTLDSAFWTILTGDWRASEGWLIGRSPSGWGIIEYFDDLKYAVYEATLKTPDPNILGISLSSLSGDTSNPDTSISITATIAPKVPAGTLYNPPPGSVSSICPATGEIFHIRIRYYESGGTPYYSGYIYMGVSWYSVVVNEPTHTYPTYLRLLAYTPSSEVYFDSVRVYSDVYITVKNLIPGSVVELVEDDEVRETAMADASGDVKISILDYIIPLRNWKIRIIIPPCTFWYLPDSVNSWAIGTSIVKSDEPTGVIIYEKSFSGATAISQVNWVIPPRATVINLTLIHDSTRSAFMPTSSSPLGDLVMVHFDLEGTVDVDKMLLYLEVPNIVSELRLYKDGAPDPEDGWPGDSFQAKITVDDGVNTLSGSYVQLQLKNRVTSSIIDVRTAYTNAYGKVEFNFDYPAASTTVLAFSFYSPHGTEWYFGLKAVEVKLKTALILSGPSIMGEGKIFTLTARLYSGSVGIQGQPIKFQIWTGSSWHTIGTENTNSTGYAEIEYSSSTTGPLTFRAVYSGSIYYTNSVSSTLLVNILPSPTLTLAGPSCVGVGRTFQLVAILTHESVPLSGKTVVLEKSIDLDAWTVIDVKTTNSEGVAVFNLTEYEIGSFYYRARFAGDSTYFNAISNIVPVEVGLIHTTLTLEAPEIVNATIPFTLTARLVDDENNPVSGRTIQFVRGESIVCEKITGVDGAASCTLIESLPGDYTYFAVFEGDETYSESSSDPIILHVYKLSVELTISVSSRDVYVDDELIFKAAAKYANATPISGLNLKYYIDGIFVGSAVTDARGLIIESVSFNSSGMHEILVVFDGDELRYPSRESTTINVRKRIVSFTVEVEDSPEEGKPFYVIVKAIDNEGELVSGVTLRLEKKWERNFQLLLQMLPMKMELQYLEL